MTRRGCALGFTVVACAAGLSACGGQDIRLDAADRSNPNLNNGAELFAQRCGGCHTLDAAGTEVSASSIKDQERTDGPNFNVREEEAEQILYAIRNGGFSGAIMPQNLVTGENATDVAAFLAKYAGRDAIAPKAPTPQVQPTGGTRPETGEDEQQPKGEPRILGP